MQRSARRVPDNSMGPKNVGATGPKATVRVAQVVKSMHQGRFDIDKYERALGAPVPEIANTAGWMCEDFVPDAKERTYKVLLVGPGAGRLELPFVSRLRTALAETKSTLEVTFIDYSKSSIDALVHRLSSDREYSECPAKESFSDGTRTFSYSANNGTAPKTKLSIWECDFETTSLPANYDFIVAFFVVSFFDSWMAGLKKLLISLAPGGSLFVSQDVGDIRFLDNTFSVEQDVMKNASANVRSRDEDFRKFWKEYYRVRGAFGFAWNPIISPSDMSIAEKIFQSLARLGTGTSGAKVFSWVPIERMSWKHWVEMIRGDSVFNCLAMLPASARKKLASYMEEWLEYNKHKPGDCPTISAGHKIVKFTASENSDRIAALYGYVIASEYDRAAHRYISVHPAGVLNWEARGVLREEHMKRLLTTNDQLPMIGKTALSIVSYSLKRLTDPTSGDWEPDTPVLFPGHIGVDATEKYAWSYSLYMCISLAQEASGADVRMITLLTSRILRAKFTIQFEVQGAESAGFETFRDGSAIALRLGLCREKISRIRQNAKALLARVIASAAKDQWAGWGDDAAQLDAFPEYPMLPVANLRRKAERIWEKENQQVGELFAEVFKASESLCGEIDGALRASETMREIGTTEAEYTVSARSLAQLAYANAIIGAGAGEERNWNVAAFVPARSITVRSATTTAGSREVGVLGCFCYARIEPQGGVEAQDSVPWRQTRDLLEARTNLYGFEALLQQYAKLVHTESVRSAIATIMGRVNAHDLGHVLEKAKLPVGEDDSMKDRYLACLTSYIRTRMVFAAEAAGSTPGMTLTLPFMSGVLGPFTEEPSPVLPGIAVSEGVKAVSVVLKKPERDMNGLAQAGDHDRSVAIPGGTVGAHALYCILENIIRNGSKYGDKSIVSLEVQLVLEDCAEYPKLLRVRVSENRSKFDRTQFRKIESYFPPSICPRSHQDDHAWKIVGATGSLEGGGFGIKEMRINAAWLRRKPLAAALIEEEGSPRHGNGPPLLTPVVLDHTGSRMNVPENGEETPDTYMGYEFYLLRPEEVIVVSRDRKPTDAEQESMLNHGNAFTRDLASALVDAVGFKICVIQLPAEETRHSEWLDIVRNSRDALPSIMFLAGLESKELAPAGCVLISQREFNAIVCEGNKGKCNTIHRVYRRWIKEVLNAPGDYHLVLDLRSSARDKNPSSVWCSQHGQLAKTAEKLNWRWSVRSGTANVDIASTSSVGLYDRHVKSSTLTWDQENYFYQQFSTVDPTGQLLMNPPVALRSRTRLLHDLLAAAISKVGIIDERIRGRVEDCGIAVKAELAKQGIYVPDDDTGVFKNRAAGDKSTGKAFGPERLISWLKARKLQFLVIHQGIIDKIAPSVEDAEELVASLRRECPFIIVVSDRGEGMLPNLPKSIRFLPFSSLEPWIDIALGSARIQKYYLLKVLLASCRGKQHD